MCFFFLSSIHCVWLGPSLAGISLPLFSPEFSLFLEILPILSCLAVGIQPILNY